MINPFFSFFSFGLFAICLYFLGFSNIYNGLELETITYVTIALLVNILMGFFVTPKIKKMKINIRKYEGKPLSKLVMFFFIFLVVIDFLYAGTIPVLRVFYPLSKASNGVGFIPLLHVILVIFSVFITQYAMHLFLIRKSRHLLFFAFLVGVVYPLLLVGRGMLFINLFASFLTLLFYVDFKVKFKTLFKVSASILALAFLFGKVGEIRSSNSATADSLDSSQPLISQISQPSESFTWLGLNPNLLWPYIYIVSPLGNFDNLVSTRDNFDRDIEEYFVSNYVPNFLQSYMSDEDLAKDKSDLVVDIFNTYGAFGSSFQQFGWIGVSIYFFFVLMVIFTLISLSSSNISSAIIIQFLCVGHTLSWFSNLYVKEIVIGPIIIGVFLLFYSNFLSLMNNYRK